MLLVLSTAYKGLHKCLRSGRFSYVSRLVRGGLVAPCPWRCLMQGSADTHMVRVYTVWLVLISCSTAKGWLHEIVLGLCGGSMTSGVFHMSQVNWLQPLLFILDGFCEENLFRATKPSSVPLCECRQIVKFVGDKNVQPFVFSKWGCTFRVCEFSIAVLPHVPGDFP
jgi:hypothetical protein